ncbi:enoyl-CoA hydratase [Tumebacillus algifaecis]|uniref:Enoyl-CoA hydratase n=1 Tax=Tumebacillus algifaecis TaxID=1214604 RepID=A0A223CY34_9BACL|nr:enoyl-CoA hydratase-related protein [Tumebacillus algifaecis]ASS74309.1 enoyl-CoA hydratase [Tumebacillus algifaecis]
MALEHLLFEVKDGIATIILNRPEARNAFSIPMIEAWVQALEECRDRTDIRVVVLTANGRAFCAGGDVKAMREGRGFLEPGESELDTYSTGLARKNSLWKLIQRVPLTLEQVDKPVIAAVNGDAIGAGCDMALMCDLRVAADTARFAEAYVKLGIVPGDGGAYYLPRLVGMPKALELLLTGDMIDAQEALRIGMVNRVVSADQLLEETYRLARKIADQPPVAVQLIKRAAYQSATADLRTALDLVSSHMAVVTETEDHQEAVQALLEKRPGVYKGR